MTTCSSDDSTPNDVWCGDPALPTTNWASLSLALLSVARILLRLSWLRKLWEHGILLVRIPKVSDLQAWLVLLFCAVSKSQLHSLSCPL